MRIVPGNLDEAVRAAFLLAMRMRLWELGLPTSLQQQCLKDIETVDEKQECRIVREARVLVEQRTEAEVQAMREEVVRECKAFFAQARLQQLVQPLKTLIQGLVHTQALTIIPTDERFSLVLEGEPSSFLS